MAKTEKSKVITMRAERMMLNNLLGMSRILAYANQVAKSYDAATIQRFDPDVIVGHEFSGVTLDVLLHRMQDLKADLWSRIGRFRRDKMPRLRNGLNSHILNGRFLLDLASEGSKVRSNHLPYEIV